jgi:hypothetical protein
MREQPQGQLQIVEVPWMVSTSVSGLRVAVDENGPATVRVDVAVLPRGAETGDLDIVRVALSFAGGQWVRTYPALDDVDVLPRGLYEHTIEPPTDPLEFRRQWMMRGLCPDPGVYQVVQSRWLERSGASRFGCVHHVIVGHDMWVEILSKGMTWGLMNENTSPAIDTSDLRTIGD